MGRGQRAPNTNMDVYRPRSEFEGDEDDTIYSAPSRPQQSKKHKQKQADLELNEDNYPTL